MIGLVDCNNFYASCERVFNPKIENKPVIVLSNNDGCVIARSNESKELGIKMGQPAFELTTIIQKYKINVFSSNYALYGDMSRRVMDTLSNYSPNMEIYSIDEAFIDLSGLKYCSIEDHVKRAKNEVFQNTGIPVAIGVGKTKTLAKLANRYAKKNNIQQGIYIIDSEEIRIKVLKTSQINDVWGIGSQYRDLLNKAGIYTVLDFTNLPESWIKKNMSVIGLRIQKELKGEICYNLEIKPNIKKTVCNSQSFGTITQDKETIKEAVATFASRCAETLRKQNTVAGEVEIFISTNYFRQTDGQYQNSITVTLPEASNSSFDFVKAADQGLNKIFKKGYNYKKAGVIVSKIVPAGALQFNLFSDNESGAAGVSHNDSEIIMKQFDRINKKYGRDKIRIALAGFTRKWRIKQELLSPPYSTSWPDMLKIKI